MIKKPSSPFARAPIKARARVAAPIRPMAGRTTAKGWAASLPPVHTFEQAQSTHENRLAELERLASEGELSADVYFALSKLSPDASYYARFAVDDYEADPADGSPPGYGGTSSRYISFVGLGSAVVSFALALVGRCYIVSVECRRIKAVASSQDRRKRFSRFEGRPLYDGEHVTDLRGKRLRGAGERRRARKRGLKSRNRPRAMSREDWKKLQSAERSARYKERKTRDRIAALMRAGRGDEARALQRKADSARRANEKRLTKEHARKKVFKRAKPRKK
jgi:hypothetical protein